MGIGADVSNTDPLRPNISVYKKQIEARIPGSIIHEVALLVDMCARSREAGAFDRAAATEGALLQCALGHCRQAPGADWAVQVLAAKVWLCAGERGQGAAEVGRALVSLLPACAPGDSAVHAWVDAEPGELDGLPAWMEEHIRERLSGRRRRCSPEAPWSPGLVERTAPAQGASADPETVVQQAEGRAELARFASNVLGEDGAEKLSQGLARARHPAHAPEAAGRVRAQTEFALLTDRLFGAWLVWRLPWLAGAGRASRGLLRAAYAKLHRPGGAGEPAFRRAKHLFVQMLRGAT